MDILDTVNICRVEESPFDGQRAVEAVATINN
jgi:hypothetical protein